MTNRPSIGEIVGERIGVRQRVKSLVNEHP